VRTKSSNNLYRGVGFLGEGRYKAGEDKREYRMWSNMLTRCYYGPYHERFPTYVDCTVDPVWHNYQIFSEWVTNQRGFENCWVLDKDILIRGNKIYSPETCCLVPSEINSLIVIPTRKGKTEPTGVSFQASSQKYIVSCAVKGKNKNLGRYSTIDESVEVYKAFKKQVILSTANKYKDLLREDVYEALINYVL
jgi:hypothetical protein